MKLKDKLEVVIKDSDGGEDVVITFKMPNKRDQLLIVEKLVTEDKTAGVDYERLILKDVEDVKGLVRPDDVPITVEDVKEMNIPTYMANLIIEAYSAAINPGKKADPEKKD